MDMAKDPLFRGEFEVIKELMAALPDGEAAKRECDKVIDKNGPAKTGGTGIKQTRENIAESKLSYEIMDDAAQAFLKQKIMDNIQVNNNTKFAQYNNDCGLNYVCRNISTLSCSRPTSGIA